MSEGVPVRVAGLAAGYGRGPWRRDVLSGVGLQADPGEVTAVIGPNGAGKTTLFRVLLGFFRPRAGTVRIGGLYAAAHRRRHGVAYLPEATPRPAGWSLDALLAEGCDLQRLRGAARRDAVRRGRRRSGLGPADRRRPLARLSKGTARRALLAYVLLGDPRLVLLDEPLSGLDADARASVRSVVGGLAERGATVLVTGHELDEVARLAHRAVVLRDGLVSGTVDAPSAGPELEAAVRMSTHR